MVALVCYGVLHRRARFLKFASAAISVSLMAAIGFVPSASATAAANQKKLSITNTVLVSVIGTPIHVKASGGSGNGKVTFSVKGTNCSVGSSTGVLSANAYAVCFVKAAKAASKGYKSVTSAPARFVFNNRSQATLSISNSTLTGTVGTPITVTTSGGSGNGSVTYSATGTGCSIDPTSGSLDASAAATCVVTATKSKSTGYKAVTSAGVSFVFSAASGGGTETPTFAHPDVATMTSVSGTVTSTPLDDTVNGDAWFIDAFYSPGDHWNFSYVVPGASITENWHVVGSSGQALAHTTVTLETRFAGTDSTWTATGMDSNGYVTGTTDASGNVSFTLTNGDTSGGATPADTTTAATALSTENTNPWTRMALVVGTAVLNAGLPGGDGAEGSVTDVISAGTGFLSTVNQATDLVDFVVIPPASSGGGSGPSYAKPDVATLTAVTGTTGAQINDTANATWATPYWYPSDNWYVNYVTAGSTVSLTYHVVGYNGTALANTAVTLTSNLDYSNANGVSWSGNASSLNVYPGGGGGTQGTLAGTTDANGNVTFTLVNSNAATGSNPADTTDASAVQGNESSYPWTDMVLQIGSDVMTSGAPTTNVVEATDRVDFIVIPGSGGSVGADTPTYAHPDTATLSSVTGIDGSTINDTTNGDNYFINAYYSPTDRWLESYVDAGSAITLNWTVDGSNGEPLANQVVTLETGFAPGATPATWSGTGMVNGDLTGTTDANGTVSFTVTNTNPVTGSNPADTTTTGGAETNEGSYPWSRMALIVGTATSNVSSATDLITANPASPTVNQATDLADFIVIPGSGGTAPSGPSYAKPDVATLTAVTGTTGAQINDTANATWATPYWYPSDNWYVNYVTAGSTVSLTYHVVGYNGTALANTAVTLTSNLDYSNANGVSWSGNASSLNVYPGGGGGTQGTLAGTTDANGNVTFTLVNSNAATGSNPADTTDASAVQGNESSYPWTDMVLQIGSDVMTSGAPTTNVVEATDRVDFIVIPSPVS